MPSGRLGTLLRRPGHLVRASRSLVVFGLPVLLLAVAVRQQSGAVVAFDRAAIRLATDRTREAGLTHALVVAQEVSKPVAVYAAATLVVRRVGRRAGWATASRWAFATMMSTWALGALAKLVVRRPRPVYEDPFSSANGFSFPSGHALNITAAVTVLLLLLWPLLSPARRRLAVGLAVVLVVAVSADRVLLGVHHPSDVVAGVLLGLAVTLSSWTAFGRPPAWEPAPGPRQMSSSTHPSSAAPSL